MTQLCWPNGSTSEEPPCTDAYGPRAWSAAGVRAFHTGDDSAGYARIMSIGAGTVVETGSSGWAGNYVLVYLGEIDGRRTWVKYCHLASPSHLRRGDQVGLGDFIGIMGATGVAYGVHLHMEMYLDRVDRGGGTGPGDVGTTIDPRAFIRARLTSSGGLPMFALYWTGPQVNNTRVSGRMVTPYGSFWVPSMQIMGLLNRRHDAALKPGDNHDNMLDAEHDIINGFLQTCFKSVLTGVTLDPAKLRSALTDALKAAGTNITVDANTDVPVEDLAKAFEAAAPRIAAAMVKQAGQAMSK